MVTRSRLRALLTTIALQGGAALLVGYFWVNAHSGNHGLTANLGLLQQETELSSDLTRLRVERAAWEHRVQLLRPERLDPDSLDERARAQLDFVDPHDVVMRLPRR